MPPKTDRLVATQENQLILFLQEKLTGKSRTTIKSLLSHRQIAINGNITTQFNAPLQAGDEVTVSYEKQTEAFRHPMLRIVFEDDFVIVIEKRSGLLSMGTDRERERTAYFILSTYVKKQDPRNRIFILHRLDRDTSGLMIFAKSEQVKEQMQANWDTVVTERKYVAVAEGQIVKPEGTISTFLTENKGYKVFVSNKMEGERAITSYRVLKSNENYTLVELQLSTGKKNQIRAHLEYIGHSIAGDRKYGAQGDPLGRVALHANKLSFIHPKTGEEMKFTTAIPAKFESLF